MVLEPRALLRNLFVAAVDAADAGRLLAGGGRRHGLAAPS
jgi:hypothetical protein